MQSREIKKVLTKCGLKHGQHVMVHSAFRSVRSAWPAISIETLIRCLKDIIGSEGSLIMPAFTYCFKKSDGSHEIFNRLNSPGKVGAVSEVFRLQNDVLRTASPTHSFALWGSVQREIAADNNPSSPLGEGSVPDWLAKQKNAAVFLLGVDFSAMSFIHYLEHRAPVPWVNVSPWKHINVLPVGVSSSGETELHELPGCSRSFIRLQQHLDNKGLIHRSHFRDLKMLHIDIEVLMGKGITFLRQFPERLLCTQGTCRACDERWQAYLTKLKYKKLTD